MLRLFIRKASSTTTNSASHVLPPPIASLKEIGRLSSKYPQAHPELFGRMKLFYANIAKGTQSSATTTTYSSSSSLWSRYYATYIAKDSPMPLLHLLGVLVPFGYYIAYFKGGVKKSTSQ